ncbi:MAG: DUF4982 domain-containing protein [Saprospiraceae bacterium]|nr:DUF4982 domain-containing protein [Saprospiraceae bacterium]
MRGITGTMIPVVALLAVQMACQPTYDAPVAGRVIENFDQDWRFHLGDVPQAKEISFNDEGWRPLNVPHDWSIEGQFSRDNPAGAGGGALPGGIGWYRKQFKSSPDSIGKHVFIQFDGIYCNSEVWINGQYLGKRPNGYISFQYDLTPNFHWGRENVIAVRVDNSQQPNSRWYSGSGIYRHVRLITTQEAYVDQWGTHVLTPEVSDSQAIVQVETRIRQHYTMATNLRVIQTVLDAEGRQINRKEQKLQAHPGALLETQDELLIKQPRRWSVEQPEMYTLQTDVRNQAGELIDRYETPFGIRDFHFDPQQGLILNGKRLRLFGVCMHHDLGALGSAVNTRAMQRQLEILRGMGVNAIRTSHNPPAPEWLDLCDQMGFVVMDEAFDMWKRPKNPYDYHLYWDEWHTRDLQDQILRDRNHPSVMMWSVGNEIPEQSTAIWKFQDGKWINTGVVDSSGYYTFFELKKTVRGLDKTRPVTVAIDQVNPQNALLRTGQEDLICYNYRHPYWSTAQEMWGDKPFLATEAASAFETRGYYRMPSDQITRAGFLPPGDDSTGRDMVASSYDNFCASWASTHEESLQEFFRLDAMAGTFIWTGFDYLGEPTPYGYPARSSYFGIVDLAGFPKDAYYLYQSVWTDKPVLHLLPHWNWSPGDTVDVWAYYNQADEVELYLNGRSLGVQKKIGDSLHVQWRTVFEPGVLRAVSRKEGRQVLETMVQTAGEPAKIEMTADRDHIQADGRDLSFITVRILDDKGIMVPNANNHVAFSISGPAFIAGVDNGLQTSLEPFKAESRNAFNGKCLVILQSTGEKGTIIIQATSEGLTGTKMEVVAE